MCGGSSGIACPGQASGVRAMSSSSESAQKALAENKAGKFSIKGDSVDGRSLYLDMQATTPVDPRAGCDDAVADEQYGNAHSRTHGYGWEAEDLVEDARKQVADLIGASPREIVFTSGATESNNMAIKGVGRFAPKKKHIAPR